MSDIGSPSRFLSKVIFGNTPDGVSCAWLLDKSMDGSRPAIYAEGYKMAADTILQQFQDKTGGLDLIVYPVMFLYRHHFELSLKLLRSVIGEKLPGKEFKSGDHGLNKIWEDCIPYLRSQASDDEENFTGVTQIIRQFDHIDPHPAENFRYPQKLKGGPTQTGKEWIDLSLVRAAVDSVSAYLAAWTISLQMGMDDRSK